MLNNPFNHVHPIKTDQFIFQINRLVLFVLLCVNQTSKWNYSRRANSCLHTVYRQRQIFFPIHTVRPDMIEFSYAKVSAL